MYSKQLLIYTDTKRKLGLKYPRQIEYVTLYRYGTGKEAKKGMTLLLDEKLSAKSASL